jgi:UDP-glucose 4-epimerase
LGKVKYNFTGGDRGWQADVPIYRLDTKKIQSLGWKAFKNSKQAVESTINIILDDLNNGLYDNL